MNNLLKLFIIAILFSFYKIDAQYVEKKNIIAGTEISFSLDERINDALVKIEDNCTRNITPERAPKRILVPSRELTKDEICKKNPKIMGFKIQVIIVKNNDEATRVSKEFRNSFRSLKVEKDASLRPNYKILAGSYLSKQSASTDLKNIKKTYPSAIIVPYAVYCVEAK